ncbi:hypothetical protein HYPSUDRAFT_57754 [Hypholoma sublateritium FD-334 SS-4]|uniref:Mob1/phocein n=1 Tax=Hypholoma sublateritium (strain FD-334 SS-4) TaxID=945553 RepID=A0A0D2NLB8_HYPSF|nr:hypothetical protein HYPSUDRAFT_57754 [Hypholoma sublateritium FD-334 SS-4]
MTAAIQRPLRGSRISTFYPVKDLPSLASLDSAFQLQEYISLLIRFDVHDVDRIVSLPGSSAKDKQESAEHGGSLKEAERLEVSVDEACWIYEQLRRLAQDLSHPLITTLQQECTRASCPEMKAGEWLYLCVAHGNDGAMEQCCAIDYILHTVDSATALLNSPRTFPSRLQIPQTSHRHFASLARRLGRIFAHAYFHHREAFEQAEAESSLYARFLALTARFDLVPAEFLVIPADGADEEAARERDVPRGFAHYPPQLRAEDHRLLALHQQQAARAQGSPPLADVGGSGSGSSGNGGGGETEVRVTRPRTGTMVLSDPEASAVAEELAARRAEPEYEYAPATPATGRPQAEEAYTPEEEELAEFEIVLSPEEPTGAAAEVPAEEHPPAGAVPVHAVEAPAAERAPSPSPLPAAEATVAEAEKEPEPTVSAAVEPPATEEVAVSVPEAEAETAPTAVPEPVCEAPPTPAETPQAQEPEPEAVPDAAPSQPATEPEAEIEASPPGPIEIEIEPPAAEPAAAPEEDVPTAEEAIAEEPPAESESSPVAVENAPVDETEATVEDDAAQAAEPETIPTPVAVAEDTTTTADTEVATVTASAAPEEAPAAAVVTKNETEEHAGAPDVLEEPHADTQPPATS